MFDRAMHPAMCSVATALCARLGSQLCWQSASFSDLPPPELIELQSGRKVCFGLTAPLQAVSPKYAVRALHFMPTLDEHRTDGLPDCACAEDPDVLGAVLLLAAQRP